jgi:c(7)-type cytochrome triheme protein
MRYLQPQVRFALLAVCLLSASALAAGTWKALKNDGIHDPSNPAIEVLQEPEEALSRLPPDTAGNMVHWVRALRDGYIDPRAGLKRKRSVRLLESDVLFKNTSEMPWVLFPHRAHTEWLDCKNCHTEIFEMEVGQTPISMFQILNGEKCGVCHGAVSFPLTECRRCHSVSRVTGEALPMPDVPPRR